MIRVSVFGCLGRMGKAVLEACLEDSEIVVVSGLEKKGSKEVSKSLKDVLGLDIDARIFDDPALAAKDCDVIIDFSEHSAACENISKIANMGVCAVVGTTGFLEDEMDKLDKLSEKMPIVLSPNMSLGVNLLYKLCEICAQVLKNYDIEIIEAHHNMKKDAPSGTAKKIADVIKKARGDVRFIYGRSGFIGERDKSEIGIHAIRAGDIVGDHIVLFSGGHERIELVHRAHSRKTFAKGAIYAAKWVFGKKPALYSMSDVLGV